jgi:hypothetical protein
MTLDENFSVIYLNASLQTLIFWGKEENVMIVVKVKYLSSIKMEDSVKNFLYDLTEI